MYTAIYVFIAGVTLAGLGIGFYLQAKLEATHQDVSLPSAFTVEA